MLTPSKVIYNTVQVLLISYLIYCLIFIIQHFLTPNIGEITLRIGVSNKIPTAKELSLELQKPPSKYYVLIYEDTSKPQWLYLINQNFDKHRQALADIFLPKDTTKYIFLEGTKQNKTFIVLIKPKYPVNYISNKKSRFHIVYLVPYRLFPFPEFYYCKYNTFDIDELE